MKKYYDITNPDASYDWIHETLHINEGDLIKWYCIDCCNNFDAFCEVFSSELESLDVMNMDLVAFQVTTNNDECSEIKRYGLHNLQWVLSQDTKLKKFLQQRGICFDVAKKHMFIDADVYNVDYDQFRGSDDIMQGNKGFERIGHKLYYDFQVNAFLFCDCIDKYSTIHEAPEFLYTLSSLNAKTRGLDRQWAKSASPYVVKFKAKVNDFAYFTFYEQEQEYLLDSHSNWVKLKRILLLRAIESAFNDLPSEVFAYMKPETVIKPSEILEYIPIEEWGK